ncbi:alpha/beta fold hydrolase [Cupriavidus taiwanensis]|uniref:alpha/beta fold hydrolase n=1 Tax=Cupriavidus taiwanensis TaxID=164546 RepID=UPI000E1782F4|nr:alpha/beta fold hydrolase [Cupriavidus taiwanensis]SOY64044.1 Alpha/beta fold family hydrolase/acetyltransferase [Cupriavidus taiwanensis]SPC23899.1 Alpha/beta fold family hydrolase/acetyltransferase [Cupriavidus taiwanensis]
MCGERGGTLVTSVDGCEVIWRSFGDGPATVLLHGGHGNWRHWTRNIGPLSRNRRLLVPDMPGFGDSGAAPRADLPGLVDVLARSLACLSMDQSLNRIDLVGFSFGALVTAHLATHAGLGDIEVGRLALLGPAGHGGPRRMPQALVDWRRCLDPNALAAAMRHNLAALMIADPAAIDSEAVAIHTRACRATRFHSKSISRAGGLQQALARFPGAVLMIWGEADVTMSPESIAGIARDSRDASADAPEVSVNVVPGVGHWVQYEAHQQVNGLLQDWLQQSPHTPAQAG